VLSEKRATTIIYFLATCGIEKTRLDYTGKSADDPIGDNKTPEGRALNRRVEIDLSED
jgi:type VI secretion system protein ImpK